ncbi:MAG: hypothetical protein KDD21_09370 [Bacteroidetes bacterium]|nr:hypothetical protein [Bacteroidota bacterium]
MNKLILLFLLFAFQFSKAEENANINYVDVNQNAFTIPLSETGGNYLNAYNLTVLDLAQSLSEVYKNGERNKPYPLSNFLTATKVFYTPDNSQMMIIEPQYANSKKRCILLTNGNGEDFSWSQTNRMAIDFALRGYVVAYYENAGSNAKRYDGKGNTSNFYTSRVINQVSAIIPKDKFFATMYINLFLSNAARKFVVDNSQKLSVDTTKFFMVGGSLGANASLFFTYADENNFKHQLFNQIKKKLNYNQPFNNNGIVAVVAYGGGLPGPKEGLGDIIDNQDKTPAFYFSGALDWVVNPNKTTILGPENWGPLALKDLYDANQINYNIYINAYGTHVFQTPSYNQTWGSLPLMRTADTQNGRVSSSRVGAYAKANLVKLLMYQYENTQMYEAAKMATTYFNQAVNNTLPKSSVTYVEPKCIQNTIFYQYSIDKLSITDAAMCFTKNPNDKKINRQLDKITTTCMDGTFRPYSKPVTDKTIVPNNFMAPGKGLVKLVNFLEVLNKMNGK